MTGLAVVGRLVGLLSLGPLVTLLTRLGRERLAGMITLGRSGIGRGLLILLPSLGADDSADDSTDHGQGEHGEELPHPGGCRAALSRGVARTACSPGGVGALVLSFDLVRLWVGESDFGAIDLAAVGLGHLPGEGDRLGEVNGGVGGAGVELGGHHDELVVVVGDDIGVVGDPPLSLKDAGAGIALLFVVGLQVLDAGAVIGIKVVLAAVLLLERGNGGALRDLEYGGICLI